MTYLKNAWYIAGWDYEITRTLSMREIMDEPVLLYRRESGAAVAMSDKCPHRYAPLHRGRLRGDEVECSYHGLRFDCSGACVHNPHPGGNGPIPRNALVRTFPTVERMGAVWVWMGDGQPEETALPDYAFIDDKEKYRTIRGVFEVNNHYEMCNDNALDLTHVTFTHAGTLGAGLENVAKERVERERVGNTLWCRRFNYGIEAGAEFRRFNPELAKIKVDKQQHVRWQPPGNILITIRYVEADTTDRHCTMVFAGNMLTPISPLKTRFFWSVTRNFALGSDAMDKAMTAAAELALERQDKPMIEDQLSMMKTTDLDSMRPVYIADDATPIQARRILKQLTATDQRASASP